MTPPALDQLRDIHLPPPPALAALLPAEFAAEWVAATIAILMLLGGFAATRWLAGFRRRRPLRRALGELSRLADAHRRDGDTTRLVRGLSALLRHYAMSRFPARAVAGLAGDDWLRFLDSRGGEGAFTDGIGTVLASRPYRPDGAIDDKALVALVGRWLRANPP